VLHPDWIKTLNLDYLSCVENKRLKKLLPRYRGQHLIQLGAQVLDCLTASPIPHKIIASTTPLIPNPHHHYLQSAYCDLPLASDSVQLAILPHILEFDQNPKMVLNEIWRVLADRGHLFILSFNPYSSLGLWRLFSSNATVFPWQGHFYSPDKICQWIHALEGEVKHIESFFFRPPLQNIHYFKQLEWMERILPWIIPYTGNVYLLIAEKKSKHFKKVALNHRRRPIRINSRIYLPTSRQWHHD